MGLNALPYALQCGGTQRHIPHRSQHDKLQIMCGEFLVRFVQLCGKSISRCQSLVVKNHGVPLE